MSAAGRLVRGEPTGTWTSRGHRWEPATRWWPDGLPVIEPHEAETALAHRWLDRFGPATLEDLRWWTGWNMTTTRHALSGIDLEEVDLHGQAGIDLPDRDPGPTPKPSAALLPALDPTPMGWKHRDWFTGIDPKPLYDRAGNIGPTIWWNGEIIGGWASTPTGIRTHVLADHGSDAQEAVDHATADLQQRISDTVITPAARTPLERSLTT